MKQFKNITEAALAAKNGDRDGFSYIYDQTYTDKYNIALRYMNNPTDADDVISDSYMKALEKIHTLKDPSRVEMWLGQIVARTALDALKKKKPMLFSSMTNTIDNQPLWDVQNENTEVQPELSYMMKEKEALINRMIDSLPDEQRICVLMYYVAELSSGEIAQILECPKGTVLSRLNYARKALKKKLEHDKP